MSKKGIAGAAFGAVLGAASNANGCGLWLDDPNVWGGRAFVPYYSCGGDMPQYHPPHPPHPDHPPKPPKSAGGGGGNHGGGHPSGGGHPANPHKHHHQEPPTPHPKPENMQEPRESDYLKRFNEGLHGKETPDEMKHRKFEQDMKNPRHPEVQ